MRSNDDTENKHLTNLSQPLIMNQMYKNINRQRQYICWCVVGPTPNKIRKILEKIRILTVTQALKKLDKKEKTEMVERWGSTWWRYFWGREHLTHHGNIDKQLGGQGSDKGQEHPPLAPNPDPDPDSDSDPDLGKTLALEEMVQNLRETLIPRFKTESVDSIEFEAQIEEDSTARWEEMSEMSRKDIHQKQYVFEFIVAPNEPIESLQRKVACLVRIPIEGRSPNLHMTPALQYWWYYSGDGKAHSLTNSWIRGGEPWEFNPTTPHRTIGHYHNTTLTSNSEVFRTFKEAISSLTYVPLSTTMLGNHPIESRELYFTDAVSELLSEKRSLLRLSHRQSQYIHLTYMRRYFSKIPFQQWQGWLGQAGPPDTSVEMRRIKGATSTQQRSENIVLAIRVPKKLRETPAYVTQLNFKYKHNVVLSHVHLSRVFTSFKTDKRFRVAYYRPKHKLPTALVYRYEEAPEFVTNFADTLGSISTYGFGVKVLLKPQQKWVHINIRNDIIDTRVGFSEKDAISMDSIEPTLHGLVREVVRRINRIGMVRIRPPTERDFCVTFINAIQPFKAGFVVKHTKLTELARFWFPWFLVEVAPGKSGVRSGTYLRYTWVPNFQTPERKESRARKLLQQGVPTHQLIEQLNEDFGLVSDASRDLIRSVKEKYPDIQTEGSGVVNITRHRQDGVSVQIQGTDHPVIKIMGARNRHDIDMIVELVYKLLSEYRACYVDKTRTEIPKMLRGLSRVARRIDQADDDDDDVRVTANWDSIRKKKKLDRSLKAGWARNCQSNRSPDIYDSPEQLLSRGFKLADGKWRNPRSKLLALPRKTADSTVWFVCNHKKYPHVGFLGAKEVKNDCLPCCYAKDQSRDAAGAHIRERYESCANANNRERGRDTDTRYLRDHKDSDMRTILGNGFSTEGRLSDCPAQFAPLVSHLPPPKMRRGNILVSTKSTYMVIGTPVVNDAVQSLYWAVGYAVGKSPAALVEACKDAKPAQPELVGAVANSAPGWWEHCYTLMRLLGVRIVVLRVSRHNTIQIAPPPNWLVPVYMKDLPLTVLFEHQLKQPHFAPLVLCSKTAQTTEWLFKVDDKLRDKINRWVPHILNLPDLERAPSFQSAGFATPLYLDQTTELKSQITTKQNKVVFVVTAQGNMLPVFSCPPVLGIKIVRFSDFRVYLKSLTQTLKSLEPYHSIYAPYRLLTHHGLVTAVETHFGLLLPVKPSPVPRRAAASKASSDRWTETLAVNYDLAKLEDSIENPEPVRRDAVHRSVQKFRYSDENKQVFFYNLSKSLTRASGRKARQQVISILDSGDADMARKLRVSLVLLSVNDYYTVSASAPAPAPASGMSAVKSNNVRPVCRMVQNRDVCNNTPHCGWVAGCKVVVSKRDLKTYLEIASVLLVDNMVFRQELLEEDSMHWSHMIDPDYIEENPNQTVVRAGTRNYLERLSRIDHADSHIPEEFYLESTRTLAIVAGYIVLKVSEAHDPLFCCVARGMVAWEDPREITTKEKVVRESARVLQHVIVLKKFLYEGVPKSLRVHRGKIYTQSTRHNWITETQQLSIIAAALGVPIQLWKTDSDGGLVEGSKLGVGRSGRSGRSGRQVAGGSIGLVSDDGETHNRVIVSTKQTHDST